MSDRRGRPLTADELKTLDDIDKIETETPNLEGLRASATSWVTTIGLLTAAFSIAVTFGFAFNINLLSHDLMDLAKFLVFVGIVAVVVAIISGSIAAQGWPRRGITGDALAIVEQRRNQAKASADWLRVSRVAAGLGVLLLLGVLGLSLWGDRDDPAWAYTSVAATPADSFVACGILVTDEETGILEVDPLGDNSTPVPVVDYSKLTKLEQADCPGAEDEE